MVGVPARRIGWMCQCGERLPDSRSRNVRGVRNDVRAARRRDRSPSARTVTPEHVMSDRSFRVALVGCGRISKNHFDAIGRSTGCRCPPCATSTPSGRGAGEEQGVPVVRIVDEMLRAVPSATSSRSARHPGCTPRRARPPRRREARRHREADGDLARAGGRFGASLRRRRACSCSSSSRTGSIRRFSC